MPATLSIPDFTLLRRIGGGAYGEVWLGRSVTGVLRAIKVIDRARFEDDRPFFRELDGITRFQQAVGDQPRQLALLHVGRDERAGVFYYVMELADDAAGAATVDPEAYVPLTLKELQRRRGVLPAEDCVRIGTELALALGELHQAGLLHRDVKPSNVIFVDGRAKLADIGLITASDYTVSSIGTPEYAAPEGTGSVRADLYSLGKILYELATGLQPDEFPRLPADLPARPDAVALVELNEIVLRACHSDPAQRYASAEALLSDLRLLQAGRSVQELNRTRRQLRTLSWYGAIAGATALLVIGVLGVRNYFALRALAAQEIEFRQAAEASEQLARYTSDLHFAQLALSDQNIGGARTALRRQMPTAGQPDLRGLEWHALWNESKGDATQVLGAVGGPPISALAVARDGRSVVVIERATPNRAVRLDLATGARSVLGEDCYGLAAFDAENGRLIVTRGDLSVDVLDLVHGTRQRQNARGILLARATDQRTLLLAPPDPDNATLMAWDVETQAPAFRWTAQALGPNAILSRACLNRDGSRLAASLYRRDSPAAGYELVVWDTRTGTALARVPGLPWIGHVRWSADGRWLALATASDVRYGAADNITGLRTLNAGDGINALEFSPDGTRLAVGREDGLLTIWSVADAAKRTVHTGHEAAILTLQWLDDGRRVVTGGMDGTCRLWETESARAQSSTAGLWSGQLGSAALSSDGALLAATGADGEVVVMETAGLRPLRHLPSLFLPFAFSANGRWLWSLTPGHTLVRAVLRASDDAAITVAPVEDPLLTAVGVSTNKGFAVVGTESGRVQAWDLTTGAAVPTAARLHLGSAVQAAAVSSDGRLVAASTWDARLQLASPDGVVDLPTHAFRVTSLCFLRSARLLVGGTERGRMIVWDVASRRRIAEFQAHSADIATLVASPDQTRVFSGGADGLVIVWMTASWRWLAAWSVELRGADKRHPVYRLDMDPTGSWLVAMTDDGGLQRWDCRPEPGANTAAMQPVAQR
ncbi:WD40 repeat domain-containing serine/threonine protein kinase [Opitutus terrae]|uniref:Serine/threonine protein kinase with WD40 repeats n=1 Tax=Opitutus terrae (strain DSM 11246 / JCM 15787 / PB90-1) TaxID=452637 RepID=B1ZQY1_OPITP|nr:protein kinase [Opitutus terrae]ACB73648.1 serine/threonine protein kinase with WD40 repeats [Opitutus terrae PB90-1]